MAIIQVRGDRHVVDNNSIAVRNGVKLGHAQPLVAGDIVITRVPEEWHMGDYDITYPERYTVGTFPAAYYGGMVMQISPACVREKLSAVGMSDRDIDRFMNVEEEEVVLLPPPPPQEATPVQDDTPYW